MSYDLDAVCDELCCGCRVCCVLLWLMCLLSAAVYALCAELCCKMLWLLCSAVDAVDADLCSGCSEC
jgi:hypothetical protein